MSIFLIPITILIMFLHIIFTDMKINFKDVIWAISGMIYVLPFIVFIPIIYGAENGKYLIWLLMFLTWGADSFALMIGKLFGKHKFTKVSPNKTVEGSVGGILGAMLLTLIYTYCLNSFAGFEFSYLKVAIIAFVLSIIGEIGDLVASCIKRYLDVKDFSNLFPRSWRYD